ncbi:MAG TPA: AMP-binding protein [Nocardioidaceae bacterium]|nr:AMP-binding protein [Nocardioidaceae bacterium]
MNAPLLVGEWPARGARHGADRVAVQDPAARHSYADLEERSTALADRLRAAGLGRGDRLATVTANSADHVVAFFGCAKAGLLLAPLSWRASTTELAAMLRDARPALVATDTTYRDAVHAALTLLDDPPPAVLLSAEGLEDDLPDLRARSEGRAGQVALDDPVLLLYSSGSTGRPKGILLSHASCWWTNRSLDGRVGMGPDDVVLVVLPQFHVAAWNVQPLLGWLTGARVIVEPVFDPDTVLNRLADERVTTTMGVPTSYQMLAERPGFADADLSSLRLALVGGAPTADRVLTAWSGRGVPLVAGYGLTEAGPNVLCEAEPGGGMLPYPGVEVALRDPVTGRPAEGDRGELLVRGPNVFAGYWGRPDETARAVVGGWLATGDIAERGPDGGYRLVGRSTAMYISGGENVYPGEVEQVLLRDPSVAAAAVVGVPDDQWGEVGVAFVVPRQGLTLDPERLRAGVRQQLAGFKVPRRVVVVDALPLTGSGKIDRPALRGELDNQKGVER